MALKDFLSMMTDTVTIAAFAGGNSYTENTWSTSPVTMKAKIMGANRLFLDGEGRQVAATYKIILGKKIEVGMRDQITLVGRDPSTPLIKGIEKVSDEKGWHHTVVYCG